MGLGDRPAARFRPALLAFTVWALAACSGSAPEPAPPSAISGAGLDTVELRPEAIEQVLRFDGVVEALNQSTIAAQASGRVVALPVDVGDVVEQGAVLVRIRDSRPRAQNRSADAALAEALARAAEARDQFERVREVYERQLVAKAQYDRALADDQAAQARVESARAAAAGASESLDDTIVRAPYSGIVVQRHIELGELAAPGRPLITGVSLEQLRVAVDVPAQVIGTVRAHRRARAVLADGRSIEIAALRIPPNADSGTHSFRVLATLPQGTEGLHPGTLVRIAFVRGEREGLLLPSAAVVRRGELTAAYVVDAGQHLGLRYVSLGTPAADGRMPVLAGLVAGERVALDTTAAAQAMALRHE